ncbi:PAS domain S-box-containing protein [Constrictibacter sp. MBR-5]|jgi:PAS domain S-box-containing protein|uniref:PAS domain S-box protein n=1 Tax=Constrictibacter sp. MBR-5 TaxID=3156467 RepID=UPI003395944A
MIAGTELLQALPVAVYTTDAEGNITFYNEAAAELWGYRPALGDRQWCGSWRLYTAAGEPLPHDQCPMAVTLREGRAVRGAEAIAERPDGTRVPFTPYPTLLRDASGQITGAINLLVDDTERKHTEIEMARLAAIVESSDDVIVSKTLDGRVTSWNAAAERLFGYESHEITGEPITRIIPPELQQEEAAILAKLQRGERIDHFDTVRMTKDGRRIHISLTVSPLRNRAGTIVGASKVARDVTERKRNEELQRLLFDELNHRVKNTLAIVQAIAQQSLRRATDMGDFVQGFGGRIQALARAHDLLVDRKMTGADLNDMVRDQVMLGPADDARIFCSGPALTLDPQASVQLALVLHELATNARKHGALAVDTGRVSVEWRIEQREARELLLEWKETGVGAVSAPLHHGFGTLLIERSLEAAGGDAAICYGGDGITCSLRLPLEDKDNPALPPGEGNRRVRDLLGQPKQQADEFAQLAGLRVLVVEDEPLIALAIEEDLLSAGCTVVGPAGTPSHARRLIENSDFDAALVDTNLGGRTVHQLLTALTSKGKPFALGSGYGREGLPDAFKDAPALVKPFGRDRLLAVIKSLRDAGSRPGEGAPSWPHDQGRAGNPKKAT